MTAKEYRICVSGTPADLASEVTQLLAQGWELYGHPFAGENDVCQAMVNVSASPATPAAAVADTAPLPAPEPEVRPAFTPPSVRRILRTVAVVLAVLLAGSFLADALIFRSGYYGRFLDPLSSAGTFERMLYGEAHRAPTGKKEVLVIGNSRVAEDFSAKIANEYQPGNFWFSNCAVNGSPASTWYYFLRDLDPRRDRYAAIAIPFDDYDDEDDVEDPANQISALSFAINRLRLTDILPFSRSFNDWFLRFQALRGSTFKSLVFQEDLRAFLAHPKERLASVKTYREHGDDWLYAYGGNDSQSLAGLSVDWDNRRVTFPPGMPEDAQQAWTHTLFHEPPQHGYTRDYLTRWLGETVDLYRGSKTKIIVYQLPRHPVVRPTPLAHLPWTTVDQLRKRSWVTVVDPHTFESLERPELFFDDVHLNAAGRKAFSPLFAETVKRILR